MSNEICLSWIAHQLEETGQLFQPNELAYLALTEKVELPIRDKLAFILHNNLYDQGYIVSREYKRCDLVILKDKQPMALLELKAMYTFNGKQKYLDSVKKKIDSDLRKCQKMAVSTTDIYAILLATHPHKKIGDGLKGTVKYIGGINKAFGTEGEIYFACRDNVIRLFKDYKIKPGIIEAGECFGTKVSILFWLFGPFNKDDRLI